MIQNVQIIMEHGKPRFAVLDYHILKKIETLIEDALDIKEARRVLGDPATKWTSFADVKARLKKSRPSKT